MDADTGNARSLYQSLVMQHSSDLYRLAFRLTGDVEAARDLCQETYLEAWRGIGGLKEPAKARAWLLQILRHRYAHWLRAARRSPRTESAPERDEPAAGEREAGDSIPDDLQRALDELDERYKEPFLLVFLHGLSCREAAELLGVPLGTILSRIHRARQRLRDTGPTTRRTNVVPLRRGGAQ